MSIDEGVSLPRGVFRDGEGFRVRLFHAKVEFSRQFAAVPDAAAFAVALAFALRGPEALDGLPTRPGKVRPATLRDALCFKAAVLGEPAPDLSKGRSVWPESGVLMPKAGQPSKADRFSVNQVRTFSGNARTCATLEAAFALQRKGLDRRQERETARRAKKAAEVRKRLGLESPAVETD